MGNLSTFCSNVSRVGGLSALAVVMMVGSAGAVTLTIDTSNVDTFPTLSSAVAYVYANDDDGPDVIDLMVQSLPVADGQVVLNKPISINGSPSGNPCDLLADVTAIRQLPIEAGDTAKAYIRICAPGDVAINHVRIRPNEDGRYLPIGNASSIVGGVRMIRPASGVGNYYLSNVFVSGNDGFNRFVDLDTADDLYSSGLRRWGGVSGSNETEMSDYGAFVLADSGGAGIYNSLLDHCIGGLSKGAALNSMITAGTHEVLGGVYGHCARDGMRIASSATTIRGEYFDRVRVIRAANVDGDESHGIEVVGAANVSLIEYVDVACMNSASNFAFRSGNVTAVKYCRGFGNFGGVINKTVQVSSPNISVGSISNSTFVGTSSGGPFSIGSTVHSPININGCIFSSLDPTAIVTAYAKAVMTFNNCAFPKDGYPAESLNTPPLASSSATNNSPTYASPHYQKVLADYDWSNRQNNDGNEYVLRPGNSVAYTVAGVAGVPLTGGAGGTEVPATLSGFSLD